MNSTNKFIIRVYGLFIEDENILLSDEFRFNMKMTKFPGGGLNYGEGIIDCLKRECLEELNQEINIIRHFYTTDFYQKALFFENHQLISIYYLAEFIERPKFKISTIPFDFKEFEEGAQSFRWVNINEIKQNEITFPIDRLVLGMLKHNK